jgi:hypothetical protein
MIRLNLNPTDRDLRIFGLLLGLFTPTFGWLICRRFAWQTPWVGLALACAILIVTALTIPSLLRWIYLAWNVAVFPLGWLVSHVVLAIVYWGVITPIGLALRILGKDPLQRGFDRQATTYWRRRTPRTDPRSYFRPF